MDKSNLFYAGFGNTFYCTDPQFQVRINWIFNQYGHIHSPKRICHILHAEGIDRSPGTDPENIHIKMQGIFHLFGCSDFYRNRNAGDFSGFLQPGKTLGTNAFKTSRTGSGFPDACTHDIYFTGFLQLHSSLHVPVLRFLHCRGRK